ncbi:MAG: hypothetical protein P8Y09_11035, partial [Deltaproteobacteria bacterium]
DLVGNRGISPAYRLKLQEPVENSVPVPFIKKPLNNTVFITGELIRFDATGTVDDGLGEYGRISLTWFSNISGYLGSGGIINRRLPEGVHRITLHADDGSPGHNASAWVEITVKKPTSPTAEWEDSDNEAGKGSESMVLILAIAGVICLVLVAFTYLLVRGQITRDGDVRIDYRRETEDDRNYNEKTEERDSDS